MQGQEWHIAAWLRDLGLERYVQAFRDAEITPEVLPELTDADLRELGLPLGTRKAVLRAIRDLASPAAREAAAEAARGAAGPKHPSVSSEAERRQLTVMFVDLVGSTALSARLDPEDMREVIRAYQDAVTAEIARFEGHVAKYMGDGLLAYFGWPKAHEDEAEQAVRAGLAVVRAVARLMAPGGTPHAARVGIATGVVVVGDLIGAGGAQEGAVVGETPNLAARLQAAAEPGQVVIADGTRRLIGRLFDCVEFGTFRPKGFADPVRAWRVAGPGAAESRFEALHAGGFTPLVGRDQELALLLERWEGARDGEGQTVLLSGEPGIGKSRLVQAFRERLRDEVYTPLSFFCSPHHQTSAFYPVVELLKRAAGLSRDEPPERQLEKLEALIARATENVRHVAPLFAFLLSIPTGERYAALTLGPQRQKERTLEALLDQLAGLAARRPALVLWEDVQWIDPSSLELLDLLVDRAQGLPALLVITFRPEFVPPWMHHSHVLSLSLNRLTRRQGTALVERLTKNKAVPPEVLDQIVLRTDGVPLFVEELTKAVLESGLLEEQGDRYVLHGGALPSLAIPASLHDSLLARLDHLAPVKQVVQVAAAIGREFSEELLTAVAPVATKEVPQALARLLDAGLVIRHGTRSRATYAFKHVLVQETAYGTLLRNKRQQLHGCIAEVLEQRFPEVPQTEPALLAHHCVEAGLIEKAAGYWCKAGQQALARSATAEAVTQLTRGLELLQAVPDGPARRQQELDIQVALGSALISTKGYAAPETGRAYARARQLCAEAGMTPKIFPALFGQAVVYHLRAEHEAAREVSEEMLRLAEQHADVTGLLNAHRVLGTSLYHLGELGAARAHLERTLALYQPAEHHTLAYSYAQDPRIAALCWLSWVLFLLGYPEQALAHSKEALGDARKLAHLPTLAYALVWACILGQLRCDAQAAGEHAHEATTLAEEQGFPLFLAAGTIVSAWALAATGRPQEGAAQLCDGLRAWQATGADGWMPYYLGVAAEIYRQANKLDEALAALDEALTRAGQTGARWFEAEAELWRLRAGTLRAQATSERVEVEGGLRRALAIARDQNARTWELRAALDLVRLWPEQGQRTRDLLALIYGWFTEGFDTPDLEEAKALLDALRQHP